jgi:hypothetical protein
MYGGSPSSANGRRSPQPVARGPSWPVVARRGPSWPVVARRDQLAFGERFPPKPRTRRELINRASSKREGSTRASSKRDGSTRASSKRELINVRSPHSAASGDQLALGYLRDGAGKCSAMHVART